MLHNLHKIFFSLTLVVITACSTSKSQGTVTPEKTTVTEIPISQKWSERMMQTILKNNPWMTDVNSSASWGYTQGLLFIASEQLWKKTGDHKYLQPIQRYAIKTIEDWDDVNRGDIKGYRKKDYNLDNINAGKILFNLFASTKEDKYLKAIVTLREQLREQPRTADGGYWHKQRYPSQMWLDGAYMATPFLAQYAAEFNEPEAFDEAALQLLLMEKHMRDEKTGLLYHGWDESRSQIWANKKTGTSRNFWGRAMGWYAMAIVDALDFFPKNHPQRKPLIDIFNRLVTALEKYQDETTSLWWQVVDQGNRKGNYVEGSASCMFVYAIAKGVRMNYLDRNYLRVAEKGYNGIIKHLIKVEENGELRLLQVCEVAGLSDDRNGSYEYYIREPIRINDPKGTGPFVLASIELNK
jgi:unsaturated rhamnogalacturonyl hydrolase